MPNVKVIIIVIIIIIINFCFSILWLALLVFAVTLSASVITTNWERYSANPILVSLEKDFRDWEFEFPAMTLCHDDRVNKSKAEKYIETLV
jgi:hypothetical protein